MFAGYNGCEAAFCRLMEVTNGFGGAVAHTEILMFAEYNGCEAVFCRLMDVTNGFGGVVTPQNIISDKNGLYRFSVKSVVLSP